MKKIFFLPVSLMFGLVFCIVPSLLHSQENFDGIIEKDGKFGIEIQNESGRKQIVKPKYDGLKLIYEKYLYAYMVGGKWGLVSIENGKAITITNAEFDHLTLLNNEDNFVFDLKSYYVLVRKDGKTALLNFANYGSDGEFEMTEYNDEIGIDSVHFAINYKRLFHVKTGGKYGLWNTYGHVILKPEFDHYEKLTDNSENIFHVLYSGANCILIRDKNGIGEMEIYKAEKAWLDRNVHWVAGSDTSIFYAYEVMSPNQYKGELAKREDWKKEDELKEQERLQKVAKVNEVINGTYQKIEKCQLQMNKMVYLIVDTFGLKCFNPETAEFEYEDKHLVQYWKNGYQLFVKSYEGKWYRYPSYLEFQDLAAFGHLFAARKSDESYSITGGTNAYEIFVKKNAELTSVREIGNSIHYAYRLDGKYGYSSQNREGYPMKSVQAVFDYVAVVGEDRGNPVLQLEYKGETFNAYHDDIQMEIGGLNTVIKCDVTGTCKNPQCRNGVIGRSVEVVAAETVTTTYRNTTHWYKGHLVPADVTVTVTLPETEIAHVIYCSDPVHSVVSAGLIWDRASSSYLIEKR